MRIVVSEELRGDHETLRGLVRSAFEGVDPDGVEVHLERARSRQMTFTGRAYPQLPSRPRTEPGSRYLIRLMLPSMLRNRGYPVTYRYRGLRTAPWITVEDWHERLVALAAHEALHIRQFRDGVRRSEVQAERWAQRTLAAWRERRLDRRTGPLVAPEQLFLPGFG